MSVTSGGTAPKGFSAGGRSSASAGSAGMVITLSTAHSITVLVPQPHRRRQILDADHHPHEAERLGRVVGRAQLEHHLVLVTEVDALGQLPLGHAPEVHVVPELAAEQILGVEPVLDHRRRRPLRRQHRVVLQVPPHVVGEELRSAVQLPRSDDLERVVVDQRDAAGTVVAVGAAQTPT